MRYIPLSPNTWTYHPEALRASKRLRWMTAGIIVRTVSELASFRASYGWGA